MELTKLAAKLAKRYGALAAPQLGKCTITAVADFPEAAAELRHGCVYIISEKELGRFSEYYDASIIVTTDGPPSWNESNLFAAMIVPAEKSEVMRFIDDSLALNYSMATTISEIHRCLENKNCVAAICNIVYEFTGNPVMAVDTVNMVLATSPNRPIGVELWDKTLKNAAFSSSFTSESEHYDILSRLKPTTIPETIYQSSTGHASFLSNMIFSGSFEGFLTGIATNRDYTDEDFEVVSVAATVIACSLYTHKANRLAGEYVLNKLLSNDDISRKDIDMIFQTRGFSSRDEYVLLTVSSTDVFVYQIMLEIKDYFGKSLDIHSFIYGEFRILLLSPTHNTSIVPSMKRIKQIINKCTIKTGISPLFSSIDDFRLNFLHSISAYRIGSRLDADKYAYDYADYKLYDVLHSIDGCIDENGYHEIVKLLEDYDNTNKTELGRTLFVYLMNSKSVNRTAENLHTHKNTVVYRINAIKKLTGLDFCNRDEEFHIVLSFKLKEIQKTLGDMQLGNAIL